MSRRRLEGEPFEATPPGCAVAASGNAGATTWTLTGPSQPNLPGTLAQEERPPPHRLHSVVQPVGRAYPQMCGLGEDLCRLGLRPGRRYSHLPPLPPALVMIDREAEMDKREVEEEEDRRITTEER